MLGRFLEVSIATPDIRESLEFYCKLGFSQAAVGEAWSHPYAVVTDGRLCLGLHQSPDPAPPSLTFVRPDLLKHLRELEGRGIEFDFRRLGNDVFNEVGWLDPSGHLTRLVEARTFSPSKRKALDTSSCGYFLQFALPAPDLGGAKAHWERLGFVGIDESAAPLPHMSLTSNTLELGLYEPAHLPLPTLRFEVDVDAALASLRALGLEPRGRVPAPLRGTAAALLEAPEGTRILLSAAAER